MSGLSLGDLEPAFIIPSLYPLLHLNFPDEGQVLGRNVGRNNLKLVQREKYFSYLADNL